MNAWLQSWRGRFGLAALGFAAYLIYAWKLTPETSTLSWLVPLWLAVTGINWLLSVEQPAAK